MAIHNVTATVRVGKSERTINGRVNAHNGKGAVRVFLLESQSLTELLEKKGDLIGVTVERDDSAAMKGLVGEEIVKAPRKPKAEKAEPEAEPAAE